jgi:GNAT superfamily N-acetyltransferase
MPDREVAVLRPFSTKKGVVQYESVIVPESEITEDDERLGEVGIEEKSYVVSRSDFMQLLKGESLMYGPLKRMISIQDGPFEVVEDGVEPAKIMPPEPIEFRTEEPEQVLERIETEIEKDEPGLTERIRDVLAGFVDRVRGVFRGGPGSGHHGHEGRPGEVGGSLPAGADAAALKEAETIGGKRKGFLKTLQKIKQTLTPKLNVQVNKGDPELWFQLREDYENWDGAASGLALSVADDIGRYFPNGMLYRKEFVESEIIDESALSELKDELHDKWVDRETDLFMEEVEALVEDYYDNATEEEIRTFLGMSEEDYTALAALDKWAIYDTMFQTSAAMVISQRRNQTHEEQPTPYMFAQSFEDRLFLPLTPPDIADAMISHMPARFKEENLRLAEEGKDAFVPMAGTRADSFLSTYFNRSLPMPDSEDIIEEYGSIPMETKEVLSDYELPHIKEADIPEHKHFALGLDSFGSPVAVMEATAKDAEGSLGIVSSNSDARQSWAERVGVDWEQDIADQTYLYIDSLASKYRGQGYGTEMMMKALGIAGENGWGLAGSATDGAAAFYDKLGAKWVNPNAGTLGTGGLAFWTPRDVERAYKLLNRIGAGDILEVERAMIMRGFNIFNLVDLDDPAALMDSSRTDPAVREARMRAAFERFWDRERPDEEAVVVVRGPLRRIVVERHLGPGDHPSGSSQQAHAGGKGGKRPDRKKKGTGAAEGVRGEREQADVGTEQVETDVAEDEAQVSGYYVTVDEDPIHFDSEEQYEQVKALAEQVIADAEVRSEELNSMMTSLAAENGGEMSGLDFAVKGVPRTIEKIRGKMLEHGLSEEEASQRINDANRYTMLFTPDVYVEKVKAVQSALSEQGWVQFDNKYKNYWKEGDDYDGYNTIIQNTETGARVELQFHTYESIAIKVRSHEIYKQLRTMPESLSMQRKELYAEMVSLWQGDYERPLNWEQLEGVVKVRQPE